MGQLECELYILFVIVFTNKTSAINQAGVPDIISLSEHTVRCFDPTVQVVNTNMCRLCSLAVVFAIYAQSRNSLTTR